MFEVKLIIFVLFKTCSNPKYLRLGLEATFGWNDTCHKHNRL